MDENIVVTFYFTSGMKTKASYSEEKFKKLLEHLKRNWVEVNCVSPEWGINFQQVTHYEVTKN